MPNNKTRAITALQRRFVTASADYPDLLHIAVLFDCQDLPEEELDNEFGEFILDQRKIGIKLEEKVNATISQATEQLASLEKDYENRPHESNF